MGLITTIIMARATTGTSGDRMFMCSGITITADSTMILAGGDNERAQSIIVLRG